MKTVLAALAAALALAAPARAAVLTFEDVGDAITSYTLDGATVSVEGGGTFSGAPNPLGSAGILGDAIPYAFLRADFDADQSFVSIDLGDFGGDEDQLFLRAYDGLGGLIGLASTILPANTLGMLTLSLDAPGIRSVVFGASGVDGSSVIADNLTFTAVPEPASWALLLAGFAVLGGALRQQRRVPGLRPVVDQ